MLAPLRGHTATTGFRASYPGEDTSVAELRARMNGRRTCGQQVSGLRHEREANSGWPTPTMTDNVCRCDWTNAMREYALRAGLLLDQ
jgi:hypothetical protein